MAIETFGPKLWKEIQRLRGEGPGDFWREFGVIPVGTTLRAGDGGTFACHVKEKVKKGSYKLFSFVVADEDRGVILAVRDGSEPQTWGFAGGIIIDSSVGTIITEPALKEIKDMEDGDELTDQIDEALFGSDEDQAILTTPEGKPFAVFMLGGDGTYDVLKGIDSEGAVCALAVIQP